MSGFKPHSQRLAAFTLGILASFSLLNAKTGSETKLTDSNGREALPREKTMDLSFVAVLQSGEAETLKSCSAVHMAPKFLRTAKNCLSNNTNSARLLYLNRDGKTQSEILSIAAVKEVDASTVEIPIPEKVEASWKVAEHTNRKDDTWIGSFRPKWQLVRIWSFVKTSDNAFQFQVNTCKAGQQSPSLQVYKIDSTDQSEEVVKEYPIFEKDSEWGKYWVLQDCIRPLSEESQGALVSLAKDAKAPIGILTLQEFYSSDRKIASDCAKNPAHFMRFLGVDGQPLPLPKDPTHVQLPMTLPLPVAKKFN